MPDGRGIPRSGRKPAKGKRTASIPGTRSASAIGTRPASAFGLHSASALRGLFTVLSVLLVVGCASVPFSFRGNPLSLLGEGADAWLVVPVSRNRRLLDIVAAGNPGMGASERALDRTETLYAGLWGKDSSDGRDSAAGPDGAGSVADSTPARDLRILATGSFPKSARSIVFPSSRGWVRAKDDAHGPWYTLGDVGASIPASGLYCMAEKTVMPSILARISDGSNRSTSIPGDFEAYLLAPAADGRIALFIDNPRWLVSAILPPDADFGIENILIFARPDDADENYLVSARISLADQRSSRALAAIVRLTLGCPATAVAADVIVSDYGIPTKRLADFADFFYF